MRIGTFLVIGSLLLQGCCCPRPCELSSVQTRDDARVGWTAGIEWAVLPLASGREFYMETDGLWQPDAGTVRAALSRIRAHLENESKRELAEGEGDTEIWHEMVGGVREKLRMYRCQAIGVVNEDERLVYLNFVHRLKFDPHPDDGPEDRRDWTKDPKVVDDGGDWFWQVYFDPTTGTFKYLSINGVA